MKNIFDEVRCIENLQKEIEFDLFKYESKYKNELEILILGYYANLLKLAKLPFPIYFEKRNNQYPPDFNIFDSKKDLIKYVEVTECLKPSRRRQQEYRNSESRNQNEYSLENLDGLLIRLNKKFLSQYSNTDLIIWINVDIFDVASCGVWHRIIVNRINEWIQKNELDFKNCSFDNIYIIDSSSKRLLSIYPYYDLIYTPKDIERNM